jgi:hypothetical protein
MSKEFMYILTGREVGVRGRRAISDLSTDIYRRIELLRVSFFFILEMLLFSLVFFTYPRSEGIELFRFISPLLLNKCIHERTLY